MVRVSRKGSSRVIYRRRKEAFSVNELLTDNESLDRMERNDISFRMSERCMLRSIDKFDLTVILMLLIMLFFLTYVAINTYGNKFNHSRAVVALQAQITADYIKESTSILMREKISLTEFAKESSEGGAILTTLKMIADSDDLLRKKMHDFGHDMTVQEALDVMLLASESIRVEQKRILEEKEANMFSSIGL